MVNGKVVIYVIYMENIHDVKLLKMLTNFNFNYVHRTFHLY